MIIFVASIVAVNAGLLPYYHAPTIIKTYTVPVEKHVEVEGPVHYDFSYSVHDEHTGDIKSQTESRKDDAVKGQYTLIDADGHKRTVDYTADDHNGFQATVKREPLAKVVKVEAPVIKYVHAEPIVKYITAPAHYIHAYHHY